MVVVVAAASACARPGDTPPAGTPEVRTSVQVYASAMPAGSRVAAVPVPATGSALPATGSALPRAPSCAARPVPVPKPEPEPERSEDRRRGSGANDAGDRARRALEAQRTPVPTVGVVPPAAIPGAEECVRLLSLEFNLLAGGSGRVPDDAGIRAALEKNGLTGIVIRPGPAFAASTGRACIRGTFPAGVPDMMMSPGARVK